MTIATQLITAVSSSQYGGATITLTHLAPFVRDSYNKYLDKYKERKLKKEDCEKFAKEDLAKEIVDGVQTFQYQINSMTTTNGQAPFLSVCMYLGETDEYERLGKELLKAKYDIKESSTILEVLKTKGTSCGLVPMIFEKETKTFKQQQQMTTELYEKAIHSQPNNSNRPMF